MAKPVAQHVGVSVVQLTKIEKESTLAIFNIALCTSCPIVNASRGNNLACNLPDNCIGLANKFVSYAELEGLLVSYIAWRMKYLKKGAAQKRNRYNKRVGNKSQNELKIECGNEATSTTSRCSQDLYEQQEMTLRLSRAKRQETLHIVHCTANTKGTSFRLDGRVRDST